MQNSYVTYKKMFDSAWWRSFDFRVFQSDVEDDGIKVRMAKSLKELSDTLKDNFGVPIPECECFIS
jgi:hypothetical protein